MPDAPYNHQNDDEDEMNSHFAGQSQLASGANPNLQANSMPMPRKAIPRKQSASSYPSSEMEQPQSLDYGVHTEAEEGSGYASYAPAPSKTALRKKAASGKEKLGAGGGGSGDNPLMVALFQIASILPGMRLEDRSVKPKTPEADQGFRAAPDIRNNSGPRPTQQSTDGSRPGSISRKNALNDLAGRAEYGGTGRGDPGNLEQSPVEKFIEKIFGSSNDSASVQVVEAPEIKQKKLFIRIGIALVVGIVCTIGYTAIPRQTQLFDTFPRDFRSADREKSFKLLDPNTAVYAIGTDSVQTPIKFFLNDPRDLIDVVALSPFQKQIFLAKTEHGVKDIDSNIELYEARAPQNVITGEAQKIAAVVTAYFNKNHAYPTTAEAVGKYYNPYDEKEHLVQFKQVTDGNTKSGEDIDQKKLDLYKELVFAKAKMEPAKPEPGTISCFNVKFISAHQSINVFIIKPYGKEGAPIIGGHTDAEFFIALEDGKPKDLLAVKPLFDWIGKGGIRPLTTVVFATQIDGLLLMILRHSAKLILTLMAFASLGFLLSLKKGDSPIFWIVVLVLTSIPAILADFSNFIP
ncbi:hypothetical protein BH10CYA1_BH10CYA1_05460 [soil metagenome]